MTWFYTNINHFTVPLAFVLSIAVAFCGLTVQRKRKSGIKDPTLPKAAYRSLVALTVLSAVVFGIALVKNFA